MPGFLHPTVAQQARAFLEILQAAPLPTASAREIEAALVSRVRARRDDPAIQRRLRDLLADVARIDAGRWPAPQCETLDASTLAAELESLLADPARFASTKPNSTAAFFAAALLLCGAAAGVACVPEKKSTSSCADDRSVEHLAALIVEAPGLNADEIAQAEIDYAEMNGSEQRVVIKNLCGMSPEEIASYVRSNFADDDDDDNNDNDVLYKGVSF